MKSELPDRTSLSKLYLKIRKRSEELCAPLEKEDYAPQPVTDVSPPRWHLAHTTWFFEVFLLQSYLKGFRFYHPKYNYLFNSYYRNVGDRWARPERGHLSRPTVDEIYAYRRATDERIVKMLQELPDRDLAAASHLMMVGIHHEEQHQELLVYDLKYILCHNPLQPVYNRPPNPALFERKLPDDYTDFISIGEGLYEVGYRGDDFCFDNEQPVQKVYLPEYHLRKGPVSNEEYLAFINDGGYQNFNLWLDDGWTWKEENQITHPLYWHKIDGQWHEMTLNGLRELNRNAPVTHISFYEAEAFATWAGLRLPGEFEWETAALSCMPDRHQSNMLEKKLFHPAPPLSTGSKCYQLYGDVWEWTYSAYHPYYGFKAAPGALGEYNGKFMINQMVLRGGSCATPRQHIRKSYRNFFHPDKRWIFSGIRLAK